MKCLKGIVHWILSSPGSQCGGPHVYTCTEIATIISLYTQSTPSCCNVTVLMLVSEQAWYTPAFTCYMLLYTPSQPGQDSYATC